MVQTCLTLACTIQTELLAELADLCVDPAACLKAALEGVGDVGPAYDDIKALAHKASSPSTDGGGASASSQAGGSSDVSVTAASVASASAAAQAALPLVDWKEELSAAAVVPGTTPAVPVDAGYTVSPTARDHWPLGGPTSTPTRRVF